VNLRPHLLRDADYRRSLYQVVLEPGPTYDDLLKPAFWAHVSGKLKVRDRIEVHAHDGSWYAELIVCSSSRTATTVAPLRKVDLTAVADAAANTDGVEIKHRGFAKWSAIRKSDKAVLVEGLDTKEEVAAWLKKPQQQAQAA
jgi:hypothetical protein